MHPLHDYISRQLADKLTTRRVVVWYDPRREFEPFIAELRGAAVAKDAPVETPIGQGMARLVEYAGSFIELRSVVEPAVSMDLPDPIVIYIAGCERDRRGSILMELEKAGECYEPQLKRLARNVLRQRFTDGTIDELLAPEKVTYEELALAASENGTEPPSLLKLVFHGISGNDAILAAWLTHDARDAEILEKGVVPELAKLVKARLGLKIPADADPAKLRAIVARYVLGGEFRLDLRCEPPASLQSVQVPESKQAEEAIRGMAQLLRGRHAEAYVAIADKVESALGLGRAKLLAEALGSIDTFRFEEKALLSHCGGLIVQGRFDEALAIVVERERSFWLERDVVRKAHWEACQRMAELGKEAATVRAALPVAGTTADAWVNAYVHEAGWYRLDLLQRRLESLVTSLDEEPEERPLAVVRRAYEDAHHEMALGFTRALRGAGFAVGGKLHQTHVFADVVAAQPKPVAYVLVDAMRYEMGVELASRLPKAAEAELRSALAALPSITSVGMGALMPEASGSFAVVEEGGKLGVRVDGAFLPDLAARRKFAASRVPKLIDLTLDDLLSLPGAKLKKKLEGSQVVLVRSQEIDQAGESGFTFHARQVMDGVIENLVRAIRKLAVAGFPRTIVTADHGHVFFPVGRDESMRAEAPGGATVELHRRCWVGRGGATPAGTVRVTASELGYSSDLDFVFPEGGGVFRAGGDLAFHHGGTSLQELVIPVLTVRMPATEAAPEAQPAVEVSGLPAEITNRMVTLTAVSFLGGRFAPALISEGRRVGKVFGAVGAADVDRDAGTVTLASSAPATIVLLLSDDTVKEIRLVLLDPATDAELYRSPGPIPVRLGV